MPIHDPSQAAFNKHPEILPPATIPPQQTTFDTLLRLADVEKMVGFKKSKIYQLLAEGNFPLPIRLGARSIRFKSSTVQSWINNLPQEGA